MDTVTNKIKALNRRRKLLPWWMKVFIFLFGLTTILIPIVLWYGIQGKPASLAFYDFETNHPFSGIGIFIISVFIIKSITAYGLWFEKKWGINSAIFDAAIGILACTYHILGSEGYEILNNTVFNVELIILIIYSNKILKIKSKWEQFDLSYSTS